MKFIDIVLSDSAAKAICWTLIHSLWQGAVAAALAGCIIIRTRRVRAAVRYNLLTSIMLLLVTSAAFTFSYELRQAGNGTVTSTPAAGTVVIGDQKTGLANAIPVRAPGGSSFISGAGDYLNTHASVITGVWLVCLLVQVVRMGGSLYQMRRYRHNGVYPPGDGWEECLRALTRMMGIRRKIVLLQSEFVNMPVTFGFLKPTILVPLGMLTVLPADQVETILRHELAHILRNDYLTNLLLYFTECVFFFNPGVRWIASRIRQEREACCDDVVLADTADTYSYFEALIAFREPAGRQDAGKRGIARESYPLQLGIGRTDLVWRIRRMIEKENKKLHLMEKTLLSVGLVILLAVGVVGLNSWQGPARSQRAAANPDATMRWTDTVPGPGAGQKLAFPSISKHTDINGNTKTCKIAATDAEGNTFQLTKVNGEIAGMVINGNVLSAEDYQRYQYIFDKIERHREAREEDESPDAVESDESDEDMAPAIPVEAQEALSMAQAAVQENGIAALEAMNASQATEQAVLAKDLEAMQKAQAIGNEKGMKELEAMQKAQAIGNEKGMKDLEAMQKALAAEQADRDQEVAALRKAQLADQENQFKKLEGLQMAQLADQEVAAKAQVQALAGLQSPTVDIAPTVPTVPTAPTVAPGAFDRQVRPIINDLKKDRIIDRDDPLSFTLDKDKLTVNGVRQPDELFRSFKSKYIRNEKDHFAYTRNGSSISVSVSVE